MGESLGQYLREAREEKGWTLEQAAFKTRILYQYLKAVEDDNYEQLPAGSSPRVLSAPMLAFSGLMSCRFFRDSTNQAVSSTPNVTNASN